MNPYESPQFENEASDATPKPESAVLSRCSTIGSIMFVFSIPSMIGVMLLKTSLSEGFPSIYLALGCAVVIAFYGGLLIFVSAEVCQAIYRWFR